MTAETPSFHWNAILAGAGAMGGAMLLGKFLPHWELEVFGRAAAQLVGLWSGASVARGLDGWMVFLAGEPVVVTNACSAADYFLIVAGLIAFQAARGRIPIPTAATIGLAAALPVAVFVNAIRIITVAYAHPWFVSRLPATYGPFLHMLAGTVVFLPSLIVLNLLLETYGRHRRLRA